MNRLGGRRRDFGFEISGYLLISKTGSHRFHLSADDRARLELDGRVVLQSGPEEVGAVDLRQGLHWFRLRYEQNAGPAYLLFRWDNPGYFQLLPIEYFLSEQAGALDPAAIGRRQLEAGASLLVMMIWWILAASLLGQTGALVRTLQHGFLASIGPTRATGGLRRLWLVSIAFLQLVLLLAAAEFGASFFATTPADWQIRHFRLNHTFKPGGERVLEIRGNPEFEPYHQVFNRQGWLENYDVTQYKPKNVYRIFYVGDSFVAGPAPMEKNVPSLVEAELNRSFSGAGTRFEVINTGTMSYSPVICYILLRYFISKYSPDLIVVAVDMTDDYDDSVYRQTLIVDEEGNPWAAPPRNIYEQVYVETEYGMVRATALTRLTLFLYEHSHLYNLIQGFRPLSEEKGELEELAARRDSDTRAQGIYPRWSWCRYDWDELTEENVDFTMSVLRRLAEYCHSRGIKLLLTGVPHYPQFSRDESGRPIWSNRPHLEIEKVARATDTAYFDSLEALRTAVEGTRRELYYYRGDMHFNPGGLKLWSEAHLRALMAPENNLLPASVYGKSMGSGSAPGIGPGYIPRARVETR